MSVTVQDSAGQPRMADLVTRICDSLEPSYLNDLGEVVLQAGEGPGAQLEAGPPARIVLRPGVLMLDQEPALRRAIVADALLREIARHNLRGLTDKLAPERAEEVLEGYAAELVSRLAAHETFIRR